MTSEIPERSHREVAAEHIRQAEQAAEGIVGVGRDARHVAIIKRRLEAAREELAAGEVGRDD
jgi:hypothetical protein